MTKLRESQVTDILPASLRYRPDIGALSYAVARQIAQMYDLSQQDRMMADIDAIPEDVIDLLAVELQSIYYDTSLSIEKKREIIKSTLFWHWRGGTASVVENFVKTVFSDGSISEWWEYGGDPYTFKIDIGDDGTELTIGSAIRTIQKIKRADTSFEAYVSENETLVLGIALQSWPVHHTPAGTLPDESTLLDMRAGNVIAGIQQKGYQVPHTPSGTSITRTKPAESTAADLHPGGVKTEATAEEHAVSYKICGADML